jgi:hypothetical protein
MEALTDRLIPIAALLIIIASQLFWLGRLIELGEPYTTGWAAPKRKGHDLVEKRLR